MGVGTVLVDLIIASNINSIEKPTHTQTHAHTHKNQLLSIVDEQ